MKKAILVVLVALIMCVNMNAQKFEVIQEYAFDDFLQYYEEWPDDEGYNPSGLTFMLSYKDNFLLKNSSNSQWFYSEEKYRKIEKKITDIHKVVNGIMYISFEDSVGVYIESSDIRKPDYLLSIDKKEFPDYIPDVKFMSEGMVFAQTTERTLISWKLLENGKSEYYNAKQTQEMLDSGLAKKLGLTKNKSGSTFYFGEFNITSGYGPNYSKIINSLTFKTPGYEDRTTLQYWGTFIGTDKQGLSYYYESNLTDSDYNGKDLLHVNIAVLDPWTKEVNIIELPAGDWDPSRNAGGLIARCSQCIDEDGNVYFTDCNKEKGVYQIKKLTNTWSEELGYSKRIIGRVNANQIPLYKSKKTSSETNGYNYEHEFLWVLEKGKTWCKVRKVDGREGFIETKYIDFN